MDLQPTNTHKPECISTQKQHDPAPYFSNATMLRPSSPNPGQDDNGCHSRSYVALKKPINLTPPMASCRTVKEVNSSSTNDEKPCNSRPGLYWLHRDPQRRPSRLAALSSDGQHPLLQQHHIYRPETSHASPETLFTNKKCDKGRDHTNTRVTLDGDADDAAFAAANSSLNAYLSLCAPTLLSADANAGKLAATSAWPHPGGLEQKKPRGMDLDAAVTTTSDTGLERDLFDSKLRNTFCSYPSLSSFPCDFGQESSQKQSEQKAASETLPSRDDQEEKKTSGTCEHLRTMLLGTLRLVSRCCRLLVSRRPGMAVIVAIALVVWLFILPGWARSLFRGGFGLVLTCLGILPWSYNLIPTAVAEPSSSSLISTTTSASCTHTLLLWRTTTVEASTVTAAATPCITIAAATRCPQLSLAPPLSSECLARYSHRRIGDSNNEANGE